MGENEMVAVAAIIGVVCGFVMHPMAMRLLSPIVEWIQETVDEWQEALAYIRLKRATGEADSQKSNEEERYAGNQANETAAKPDP